MIAEIDALGGAVEAIETGWMQARIGESAYRAQQAIERGDAVVVGVNRFAERRADGRVDPNCSASTPQSSASKSTRLQRFAPQRDAARVGGAPAPTCAPPRRARRI